jgi:tetratricopeptide (TPR) repeat protein/predicted Ser/Thr protein kinase
MVGQLVGQYRIEERLGAGGMGVVYRGYDTRLQRAVALKVVNDAGDGSDASARLLREARAVSALNHPNICTVYEVVEADAGSFIVMEYIDGRSLQSLVTPSGLPIETVLRYAIAIADALEHAHARGVVHRDLKSANIMVTSAGHLKVLDFGLARRLASGIEITETRGSFADNSSFAGTIAYMAPEVLRGEPADQRSDIWALGVVLYEMASGTLPFAGKSGFEVSAAILDRAAPALPPGTPQGFASVVERCLAKAPDDRYPNAQEVRTALEAVRTAPARPAKTRWIAAAAVLLIAALAATWATRSQPPGNRSTSSPDSGQPAAAPVAVRPAVAVMGFKNISARDDAAWLSTAFAEMLTTELAAGERLRAISGESVARARADLSLTDADGFAKDTLARIRSHLGADLVVLGSYVAVGARPSDRIRLDLRLQDTAAGETVAAVSESGSELELFELVSRAGARLRDALGIARLSAAEATGTRVAVPSTPEAARLYSEGLAKLRVSDALGARELLTRAIELEPEHALAHNALAAAWAELGYDANARAEARQAYDLSLHLSREDRLTIEGRYRETVREWAKAVEVHQTLFTFFPDNVDYGLRLVSAQIAASKPKDALTTVAALRALPAPTSKDARIDLAEATAARATGDNKRAQAAAANAAVAGEAQGARVLVAQARLQEGAVLVSLGEVDKAKSVLEEARRTFIDVSDKRGEASALNSLGALHINHGQVVEAQQVFEQALTVYRAIGNQSGVAQIESNLGNLRYMRGDLAGARARWEATLAIYRQIDNEAGAARTLLNIGASLASAGDRNEARASFARARESYEKIGDRNGVAVAIHNIGQTFQEQGELDTARRSYEEAVTMLREVGNKSQLVTTLMRFGDLLVEQADLARARRLYDEALAISTEARDQRGIAVTRRSLAWLALEDNRAAEAEALARTAADDFGRQKAIDREASARGLIASAQLAQGRAADAQATLREAERLFGTIQNASIRLSTSVAEARVRAATGDVAAAERRLTAIVAEARKLGYIYNEYEARLALGEVAMNGTQREAARTALAALEGEAKAKGMLLVARKAAALRARRS